MVDTAVRGRTLTQVLWQTGLHSIYKRTYSTWVAERHHVTALKISEDRHRCRALENASLSGPIKGPLAGRGVLSVPFRSNIFKYTFVERRVSSFSWCSFFFVSECLGAKSDCHELRT